MDDSKFGLSGGEWIFGLIVLLALFNGGFGGLSGAGGAAFTAATSGDIQRAVDLNAIQEGQADIRTNVQRIGYENMATTKDAAYNNLSEIRDLEATVNAGFAAQQKCCCDTLRAIDSVNYNGAINTANINATTTSSMQKVLDAIQQNKIDSLTAKVNELQTQAMLCGIPRISPYGYGVVPQFAGCGCYGYSGATV